MSIAKTMTRLTVNPAPEVLIGAAEWLPETVDGDGRASRRPQDCCPDEQQVPAAVGYAQFRTSHPDAMRRFFAGAYAPGWGINRLGKGAAVTHRRCETRSMTIDEVLIQARIDCEISADESVIVIQPRAGSLTVTGEKPLAPDFPVLVAHGMPCGLHVNTARFDVVTIAADVLHRVAAEGPAPLPQQIRFAGRRPRSRAAVRGWHRALDYVTATFASPDTVGQPLLAAAAAPLLATALLECYPSTVTAERDLLSDPEVPETLKDAVAYIHGHAAGDLSVNDIAAAVHLTPRAVQYLFRQQLDTTPTEYVRRVRLHCAHQDLLAGNRSQVTVTEIAQRWGFAHTGRFAVLYRQTYGQSPHTTLKQ